MLELWRPPGGAGEPLGCLASTYTFNPGLFGEQCLARFLEIDSEPSREDFAFLLERESRLGSVYAGVLVDQTQAGVEHSLRWDILPVRIPGGKQHAKLSLLLWSRHIRIIVASANLTEPGYRTNHEVAATMELSPDDANAELIGDIIDALRNLISFVPGASERPPEVVRAQSFLDHVENQAKDWKNRRGDGETRQYFALTMPAGGANAEARSTLDETMRLCRSRGGSPYEVRIASPFYDPDEDSSRVTAALCKAMARGVERELRFCVPSLQDENESKPRLMAPKSLLTTAERYGGRVTVDLLPGKDTDKNPRVWHAKMLGLISNGYSALLVGSSNFTCAGMGVGEHRNAEANLLTIVDYVPHAKQIGRLEAIWPEMKRLDNPSSAQWLGAEGILEEENLAAATMLPAGFLSATYRAGDARAIILRLDPAALPAEWRIRPPGQEALDLLSETTWSERGRPAIVEISWQPVQPPERLLVQWEDHEAFMALNVEDGGALPPPSQIENMTADEMLFILAATDPSAAFRAWIKGKQPSEQDDELESATPIDLDPLRCYDLQETFLHRIRRRAKTLANLRMTLQRPVYGRQALEWRLRGFIGIEALAERRLREFESAKGQSDETLLTLADFLIVLRETEYEPAQGSLTKKEFDDIFFPFLSELAGRMNERIAPHREKASKDMVDFWDRVIDRCSR